MNCLTCGDGDAYSLLWMSMQHTQGSPSAEILELQGMSSMSRRRLLLSRILPFVCSEVSDGQACVHDNLIALVQIYSWLGVEPPRGVLLHGPPGCGKTALANAIANECDVPFLRISAPEIVSGMSGQSPSTIVW